MCSSEERGERQPTDGTQERKSNMLLDSFFDPIQKWYFDTIFSDQMVCMHLGEGRGEEQRLSKRQGVSPSVAGAVCLSFLVLAS